MASSQRQQDDKPQQHGVGRGEELRLYPLRTIFSGSNMNKLSIVHSIGSHGYSTLYDANYYRPLTKLREGYIFTGVCDSVHSGGHACMVAGGHVWLPLGGVCVVAARGACVVAPWEVCVWLLPGGAWDTTRYGDTINEPAVRILLECILVSSEQGKVNDNLFLKINT